MRILCAVGRHRPAERIIPNEGRLFSRCTVCNADLIKVGNGWRTAPRGYRVMWKEAPVQADAVVEPAAELPTAEEAQPEQVQPQPEQKPKATARRRGERRTPAKKELPAKLGGKDRRRSRDRRHGFGKKPDEDS